MTATVIARGQNDLGQNVELDESVGECWTLYRVQVDGETVANWTNEQNAHAQFVNACCVEERRG